MANCNNLLFGRFAVDLGFLSLNELLPTLWEHMDTDVAVLEKALLADTQLTSEQSTRIQAEIARLLQKHGGDAESALDAVDHDDVFGQLLRDVSGPMSSHLMPTLQGPPVAGIELTETLVPDTAPENDRYTNAREFGRGGMGRILIVHDEYLSRDVALKELIPRADTTAATLINPGSGSESRHLLQRFLREARITGNLEHPSIVPVYELGRRPDGTHFYTMKLVRGKTLHRAIQDAGTVTERMKLLPHVIDLCQAIAYAHSKGVIHRDIKPANVMVGSFGETVVIDWGLARVVGHDDPYAAELVPGPAGSDSGSHPSETVAGMPVGTPHYMSPEQADGRIDQVGVHSDVYALGVALYEVLTGTTPFKGTTTRAVLKQVRTRRPIPVTVHEPDIPPALGRICAKAMERRPEDRYGSAAEMAAELTRFTTGALVRSYNYNPWELLRHYYEQHKSLCNTALGATVLVIIVAVTSYIQILEANHRERIQRQAAEVARYEAEGEAYRANILVAANDISAQRYQKARERLLQQPVNQRNVEWSLLFAQCNQDRATFTQHQTPVFHLISAPATHRIISLGQEGEVFVWSSNTLELIHQFDLPRYPETVLKVSPDERWIAIARMGGIIELYDFRNYDLVHTYTKPRGSFNSLVFSGDGERIAAGSNDGSITVWNRSDLSVVRHFTGKDDAPYVFAMNGDGTLLLAAGDRGNAVLWDLDTGLPREEYTGVRPVVSENGTTYAFRTGQKLQVYTFADPHPVFETELSAAAKHGPLLSADGLRLATLYNADTIAVWDVATGNRVQTLKNTDVGRILSFDATGHRLACAVAPNSVAIYDVEKGLLLQLLEGHSNPIQDGHFSPDGKILLTCAGDTELKAWDVPPEVPRVSTDPDSRIVDVDASVSSGILAAATVDGRVYIMNADERRPILALGSAESRALSRVVLAPDGDYAALQLTNQTVFVVDLPEGNLQARWNGHTGTIHALDVSPDGKFVATGSWDSTVALWNARTGASVLTFERHTVPVMDVAFAADGRHIASVDQRGNLFVWDWHSGALQWTHQFPEGSAYSIAFGSDASVLACTLDDNKIALCRPHSDSISVLLGHDSRIAALEFDDEAKRLLSLSARGDLKIWDVETGQELLTRGTRVAMAGGLVQMPAGLYVGGLGDFLDMVPLFPGYRTGPEATDDEAVAVLKRHQTPNLPRIKLDTADLRVLAPRDLVSECAVRASVADAESVYREPDWNPLVGLGLRPGDEVRSVDNEFCTRAGDFHARLQGALDSNAYIERGLDIGIVRAGRELLLQLRNVPVAVRSVDQVVTREDALRILQDGYARLQQFESPIVAYSQHSSRATGLRLNGLRALNGLWVPPVDETEEFEELRLLGLSSRDRIVSFNGKTITDYGEVLDAIATAKTMLEQGHSGAAELVVEQDRFQRAHLKFSVP